MPRIPETRSAQISLPPRTQTDVILVNCRIGIEPAKDLGGEHALFIIDPFYNTRYRIGFTDEVWNELVRQKSGVIIPQMEIQNGPGGGN